MKRAHPHLASLEPYQPGKPAEELERELGIENAVKLASNENPMGPSPAAVQAMEAAVAGVHRYPDAGLHALRERLAAMHRIAPGELAFGNGSNELIDQICRVFSGHGTSGVHGAPSFVCYGLGLQASGAERIVVPLRAGTHFDVDALLEAIRPDTRLIFIDNPNNPTSTHVPAAALERLLSALPEHLIPVLDEAYVHFVDAPDYRSALELRHLNENLIVLRTFSKAYGLAATRVGYAIAHPSIVADLERVRAPFNVGNVGQAGALAALDDPAHVERYVALNASERTRLSTALAKMGFAVAPSQANFLFVELPDGSDEADVVYEALLRRGVIVRAFGPLPRHLRVTVGLPEENDRLLTALEAVLA